MDIFLHATTFYAYLDIKYEEKLEKLSRKQQPDNILERLKVNIWKTSDVSVDLQCSVFEKLLKAVSQLGGCPLELSWLYLHGHCSSCTEEQPPLTHLSGVRLKSHRDTRWLPVPQSSQASLR